MGTSIGHGIILERTSKFRPKTDSAIVNRSCYCKQWFDEECSELIDRRKQAKRQWLQDPSEGNGNNLSDVM
jgi:hypothetical protein